MHFEPLVSQGNHIFKGFLRSQISCVHFRDLVCWVLWVKFPYSLTLIHSRLSSLGIETCLGVLANVLQSFELVLPSSWHSGFTWLQPGLYKA